MANVNMKDYIKKYTTFDEPVEYKGVKIYPILTKNYFEFIDGYSLLSMDKNKIPDINIIQMSYLKYLFSLCAGFEDMKYKFISILNLCFHVYSDESFLTKDFKKDEILISENDKEKYYLINGYDIKFIMRDDKISLLLGNVEISSKDFDNIIKIISFQNFIDYTDAYVSPDVEKATRDFHSYKNKGIQDVSLEDKMSIISASNGLCKKDFKEMSYREFSLMFDSCRRKVDFETLTGKTEKPIDHWIYHKPSNPYDEVFVKSGALYDMMEKSNVLDSKL